MFEPVSIATTVLLGCAYPAVLAGYAQPSSAVSREAIQISRAALSVVRERQSSQSLFGAKAVLLSELYSIISSLHVDDDQEPVTSATYRNARQFILAIPDNLPPPTLAIDPDGEISVTWHVSRTRIFSASISESERIAYAWLDGSNRGHAVDRFRAPELPNMLIFALRTIVADDTVAFRAA